MGVVVRECDVQRAIVEYLRLMGFVVFSVPNELAGANAQIRMRRYVATGLLSGVSDLIAWVGDRTLYLEVKTQKGRLNDNQKWFASMCNKYGREYHVVRSVDDVERIIRSNHETIR
jgi:hypothetical protein